MKCKDCNYKELIETSDTEHAGDIICKLTKEEHAPFFECNCEHSRIRRDKEARLIKARAQMEETLLALKESVATSRPDIEYVYNTLREIREETNSTKLEELIQYLEAFR